MQTTRKSVLATIMIAAILAASTAQALIQTAQTGNWNATATWVGGVVPATGEALINATHTVTLTAANQIPAAVDLTVNGLLSLANRNTALSTLRGSGEVRQGSTSAITLTLGSDTSSTFDGKITITAGTLNLVKTGTGTNTLNGINSYNGTTTVNAGKLEMNGNNSLPGAVTVTAGELSMSGNNTLSAGARTVSGGILRLGGANSGTGTTTLNAGELILSGVNTFSGAVTVNSGTLSITGSGTPGSGAVAVNGGTIRVAGTGTLGSGAILLVGGTTLDLSARDATLALGASQAVTIRCGASTVSLVTDTGKGLTLGSSAPLRFDNYADAATPLTVSGGGSLTLQSGNAVTVTAAGSPLAADDHVLIADGAAGALPGSLALQGAGRAAGTTAEWLSDGGDLVLRIEDYTPTHEPADIATRAPGGEWYDAATWLGGVIPGPGDRVTVSNNVTLACGTYELERATVNAGATLTFATWNAVLNANHVTNNGTMTHPAQNAMEPDPVSGEWIPDNRVWIVCSNLTVGTLPAAIHGDYMGYVGVMAASGKGPGKSYVATYRTGGAGHGGRGGWGGTEFATPGISYGNVADPVSPGSSSAGKTQSGSQKAGKNGGGAIRIDATGDIALLGRISADGAGNESYIGGGSGGGIRIQCRTIQGNGTLQANGGDSGGGGGEGGGGRIAVHYDTTAQALLPVPTLALSVSAGKRLFHNESQFGTLYLSDARLLTPAVSNIRGWLHIPGFTSWSPASLTLTNSYLGFVPPNFQLSVAGAIGGSGDRMLAMGTNAIITVGGDLDASLTFLRGGRCTVDGNVRIPITTWMNYHSLTLEADVTAEGSLTLEGVWRNTSAPTNGAASHGTLVAAGADMAIGAAGTLYLYSNPTNGGSALLQMENFQVAAGAVVNADGGGYGGRHNGIGYGPGGGGRGGTTGAGGGYGGRGGLSGGGISNGLAYAPLGPGSAGGGRGDSGGKVGNAGGGFVRIEARGEVTVDGTVTANGSDALSYSGSGAGGGIFIRSASFGGAVGAALRANGGARNTGGGAGGGGRIAVWTGDIDEAAADKILAGQHGTLGARFSVSTSHATFAGSATAVKGTGTADGAEDGTVFFVMVHPPAGTVLLLR